MTGQGQQGRSRGAAWPARAVGVGDDGPGPVWGSAASAAAGVERRCGANAGGAMGPTWTGTACPAHLPDDEKWKKEASSSDGTAAP